MSARILQPIPGSIAGGDQAFLDKEPIFPMGGSWNRMIYPKGTIPNLKTIATAPAGR